MAHYQTAAEVAEIARDLIHVVEEHQPLSQVHIEFVWRDKATSHRDRTVLAKARKITGLNAFLVNHAAGVTNGSELNEPFFVLEVAFDTWGRLTPEQRVALVDHELMHLQVDRDDDGGLVLSMRGHDLEEFAAIVRRHGLWKSDVTRFAGEIVEQLALSLDEPADSADTGDVDGGAEES